ncbi:MAG: DUF6152 family protein [Caulobacterales bacterium]|nr:DUF6152 family protein [Caulobacterales bacterium]
MPRHARAIAALTVAATLASGALGEAGDAWSAYTGGAITLEGLVVEEEFAAPNDAETLDYLRVKDGEETVWLVYLGPPNRNARAVFNRKMVDVGDEVVVLGQRHGDAQTLEMKTERITVGETVYDLYPERLADAPPE